VDDCFAQPLAEPTSYDKHRLKQQTKQSLGFAHHPAETLKKSQLCGDRKSKCPTHQVAWSIDIDRKSKRGELLELALHAPFMTQPTSPCRNGGRVDMAYFAPFDWLTQVGYVRDTCHHPSVYKCRNCLARQTTLRAVHLPKWDGCKNPEENRKNKKKTPSKKGWAFCSPKHRHSGNRQRLAAANKYSW
jgi:hypothetical protein